MAYATIDDMVARYGANELIRLSTPEGEPLTEIHADLVQSALDEASALIDTHLRKRYLVPVSQALPELLRACRVLAHYDLACSGGGKEPSEIMRLNQKQIVEWLVSIRDGHTVLDGAIPSGDESYAQVQDRGVNSFADDGDLTGAGTRNTFAPGFVDPGDLWSGA